MSQLLFNQNAGLQLLSKLQMANSALAHVECSYSAAPTQSRPHPSYGVLFILLGTGCASPPILTVHHGTHCCVCGFCVGTRNNCSVRYISPPARQHNPTPQPHSQNKQHQAGHLASTQHVPWLSNAAQPPLILTCRTISQVSPPKMWCTMHVPEA